MKLELKFKPFNGLFNSAWISSEADLKYKQHVERTEGKYPQYFDNKLLKEGSGWEEDQVFLADLDIYTNEQKEASSRTFYGQNLFLAGTILKVKAVPGGHSYGREGDTIRTYIVGGLPGQLGELSEWPDINDEDYVIEYSDELITNLG